MGSLNVKHVGVITTLLFGQYKLRMEVVRMSEDRESVFGVFVVVVTLFAITAIVLNAVGLYNHKTTVKHYDQVKDEYTLYFDGQEVEPDAIDVSQYTVSIDDELKTVYLTRRVANDRRFTFVPIVPIIH